MSDRATEPAAPAPTPVGTHPVAELLGRRGERRFTGGATFRATHGTGFVAAERLAVARLADGAMFEVPPVAEPTPARTRRRAADDPVGALRRELAAAFADAAEGVAEGDGAVDGTASEAPPTAAAGDAAGATDATDGARARADGFAAGLEEGRRRAEAAIGATLGEAAELARALARVSVLDPAPIEAAMVDALVAIVRDVLEAEPAFLVDTLGARVTAAVERLRAGTEIVRLHLHPADAAALADHAGLPAVTADPAIRRGDFRLGTRLTEIEDRMADRLDRLETFLGDAPPARAAA